MSRVIDTYVAPTLQDYGSLVELTQANGYQGQEDGGNKLALPHHSGPLAP